MFVHQFPKAMPSRPDSRVHPTLQRLVESWRDLNIDLTNDARLFSNDIGSLRKRYDPCQIAGQDNLFRYQFSVRVLVLVFSDFDPRDLARVQSSLLPSPVIHIRSLLRVSLAIQMRFNYATLSRMTCSIPPGRPHSMPSSMITFAFWGIHLAPSIGVPPVRAASTRPQCAMALKNSESIQLNRASHLTITAMDI